MSNALALATVTATLQRQLSFAVGQTVTAVRPGAVGTPTTGVNVFLYQVTPNPAWRNADLPTRRGSGEVVQQPRIALDLHYVLSFYSETNPLEAQHLLGIVVSRLHARPALTRAMIEEAQIGFLAASNLSEEIESVKFTPALLSLEELSRLWSVLFQTTYALSIAYQASVVFIDAQEQPQTAPLVIERQIFPVPFRQPFIERVKSAGISEFFFAGDTLIIEGRQFGTESLVRFKGVATSFVPAQLSANEIRLALPNALRAGVQGVQVVMPIAMGHSITPHPGVEAESNLFSLVLCPKIALSPGALAVNARTPVAPPLIVNGAPLELCDGTLSLDFEPPLDSAQKVFLLLNEINPPSPDAANPGDPLPAPLDAQSYRFEAPSRPNVTSQIGIPFENVRQGNYLVRVQVDGAQSPLQRDENPASPTFRQFIGPQVSIQ